MSVAVAYCWASGEIGIAEAQSIELVETPPGTIEFARGEPAALRERLDLRARHACKPGLLLVPGLPEFDSDDPTGKKRVGVLLGWIQWAFSDWPNDMDNVRVQPQVGL